MNHSTPSASSTLQSASRAGLRCVALLLLLPAAASAQVSVRAQLPGAQNTTPTGRMFRHTVLPGQTIQEVIDATSTRPGDTVIVPAGIYVENVVIDKPGLVLRSQGATINGIQTEAGVVPGDLLPCISIEANNVEVHGFTILNGGHGILGNRPTGPTMNPGNPEGDPVHGIVISQNSFVAAAFDGVHLHGDNASFTDNEFLSCRDDSIEYYASAATSSTTINNNTFRRYDRSAIEVYGGHYEIRGNVAEHGDGDLVDISWSESNPAAPSTTTVIMDNVNRGCDGDLVNIQNTFDGVQVLIEGNRMEGGWRGIDIYNESINSFFTIRDNHVEAVVQDGIDLYGSDFLVENNTVIDCVDQGIVLQGRNATFQGNVVSGTFGHGIGATPCCASDVGTLTSYVIVGNTCTDNGANGIFVAGSGNQILGNTCSGNSGDGIDLDLPAGWIGTSSANTISGNMCMNNNHEGIDNAGVGTDMDNNTCQGNGGGAAADIAGTGDGAVGSVGSFSGNVFDTGGATTAAVLDTVDEHQL